MEAHYAACQSACVGAERAIGRISEQATQVSRRSEATVQSAGELQDAYGIGKEEAERRISEWECNS